MSRFTETLNGRTYTVSSHGYVFLDGDEENSIHIADLGFDEFGRDKSDRDFYPYKGFWDIDITWPDWTKDARLFMAIAERL